MKFNPKYSKWFLIFLLGIILKSNYSIAGNNLDISIFSASDVKI